MLRARITKKLGELELEADLTLGSGITVLRGESGSGKSTLANLISGALTPDSGEIELEGLTVFSFGRGINLPPEARGIGFVFQEHRLLPHLTVRENIMFPVTAGGRKPRVEFEEAVAILGLAKLLERSPSGLSGGEAQRVALGRALLGAERLLILDEPLSSLDPKRRSALMDFIERATERLDIPVLFITHSEEEMRRLASRALLLSDGRFEEIDLGRARSTN
ncbi:ATP-binding cassette domain-containing protein [Sutterella sp.]|uniref:ATP-binding cassette domain-containing protein n=1 Tax=Sutterella sp. TaxID=1981025 RepID=UPI0026E0D1A0|nr:ATP-binding cassette domain-containing protein [Sutterella sp.]MDO5531940.1 ATP-binding cassette domain-containing protein [Sutterella sp.]